MDDTFIIKPEGWFDVFCGLYKKHVGLPMMCNVRANLVTEKLMGKLKDAGLYSVWMGVECGDEKVANAILKRQMSTEQLVEAARIIKSQGIKLATQNLIGLPVADPYSVDMQTLELNRRIKPDFAWSSILFPYPGTPIAAYAREHGFLPAGDIPLLESNKRSSILSFDATSKRRLENLHKLFGMLTEIPLPHRLVKVLCDLPQNMVYVALFYAWYGYCFKIRMVPNPSLIREVRDNLKLFLKMIRKS